MGTESIYLEEHRLIEVVPASHLIQNLAKPYINLNHNGLGPKGVKDIVSAMVVRILGILGLPQAWKSSMSTQCGRKKHRNSERP